MTCAWCAEPLEETTGNGMHRECAFRMAAGSAAHVLRRCSCYVKGSTLEDPPGMTKRQAALASQEAMALILKWWGEASKEWKMDRPL